MARLNKDAPEKRHRLWWCFSCGVMKIFSDIYYLRESFTPHLSITHWKFNYEITCKVINEPYISVSVIARAGEYKNYSRDEIKSGDIHHTRGGNFRKVSLMRNFQRHLQRKNIYNETFTYPDVFVAILFTGFNFNAEAATVKQPLVVTRKPGLNNLGRVHQHRVVRR